MGWLRGKLAIERSEHEDPKAVVYHLAGPLTDTHECYELLDDVRREIAAGFRVMILDLQGVRRVTSSGIGLLAACYTSAANAGGRLLITGVPERARILLQLVHLWEHLDHFATVEDALASLK